MKEIYCGRYKWFIHYFCKISKYTCVKKLTSTGRTSMKGLTRRPRFQRVRIHIKVQNRLLKNQWLIENWWGKLYYYEYFQTSISSDINWNGLISINIIVFRSMVTVRLARNKLPLCRLKARKNTRPSSTDRQVHRYRSIWHPVQIQK